MTAAAGRFAWFAGHEARLAGRDLIAFLTGGRRRSLLAALAWVLVIEAAFHLVAFAALGGATVLAGPLDVPMLVLVSGIGFLSFALMLAQAMESVTRVLYGRADLDLILSSPAPATGLFALRTGLTALGTTAMALFLVGPFLNAAAVLHRPGWIAGYGVVAAMGMTAAAVAIALTLALFRAIGARRTRVVAQVVAAIIGAGFVIGGQAAGILLYGDLGRLAILTSPDSMAIAPGPDSALWWPARAAAGDVAALVPVVGLAALLFTATAVLAGRSFPAVAIANAGVATVRAVTGRRAAIGFRLRSPAACLREKELRLLLRDPWLISQTLMQVLYLVPPALLLWINFGRQVELPAVLVPIVVMAAGQLAGGLAWLTISGEDAPDLVATAPIRRATAMRAKVEAVLVAVAVPLALPMALLLATSLFTAAVALAAILAAVASATAIQFLFRTAARRSQFRRRQTASRIATFAEAFSSISWAAAGGLAAAGSMIAAVPAALALAVVAVAWAASPRRND